MSLKTILLVEDNPDDVELTRRAFRRCEICEEMRILVARDGAEALAALAATGEATDPPPPPDLVLLDLKLPRVEGLEVLRRLRADPRTRFVPVVILTTSLEEQDLREGYAGGANSYIRKPVDFGRFVEVLQNTAEYWLLLNKVPPPDGGR